MKKWLVYALVLPLTLGSMPADKAMEAAYIQTGASQYADNLESYFNNKYVIPLHLDKPASAYLIYKKKELTIPVGADRLKFNTSSVTLSIPF